MVEITDEISGENVLIFSTAQKNIEPYIYIYIWYMFLDIIVFCDLTVGCKDKIVKALYKISYEKSGA